jgi:hypothetical protein
MKHSIRVIVQVGDDFGSVRINLDGDDDAFDGIDMSDLAEVAARGLASFLTGDVEDDEDEIMALPLLDDEDDDDDHSLN